MHLPFGIHSKGVWAESEVRDAGGKGWGLFLKEDVKVSPLPRALGVLEGGGFSWDDRRVASDIRLAPEPLPSLTDWVPVAFKLAMCRVASFGLVL